MANPLVEAQAKMPVSVKFTPVPVLQECPICFNRLDCLWTDHVCPQSWRGILLDQIDIYLSLDMYKEAMNDFTTLFGEHASTMTVTAMEAEMTDLGGPGIRKCVEAISDAAHGLKRFVECVNLDDEDARKLASYLAIIKVRHGFAYELSGGALMLIAAYISGGDQFLLDYTCAMEISTWSLGGMPGFPDPFSLETVSPQHRIVREILETAGCFFMSPTLSTASDPPKIVQFIEANRPVDVFAPPLIRPASGDEDMPLGRGWSAAVQFVVKLRALLNLRDIAMVRVVNGALPEEQARAFLNTSDSAIAIVRTRPFPEEIIRMVEGQVADGLIRANAETMRAIAAGEDLSHYRWNLTNQLHMLMCVMKEEPAFNEVLLSIARDQPLEEAFEEELTEMQLLRGEILRMGGSQAWIREEYHRSFVVA